jgi:hypothetical protein
MKTRWDVLFRLFELKEARLSTLAKKVGSSSSSVRQMLTGLIRIELVKEENGIYEPNKKNSRTFTAFNILKFAKQRGINHNLFFSEELPKILLIGLSKDEAALADFKDLNYRTVRKYLSYLNRINLVIITSKKPLKVKFISDPVFEDVLDFFEVKRKEIAKKKTKVSKSDYKEIESLIKKFNHLKRDIKLVDVEEELRIEFASASTQLEGNTFTLEESKELILHDIVPEEKKLRESNEVKNYYNAINYLDSHLEDPLSIELILDLHRISMYSLGVKEGIRSSRVSIRGNPFYKVAPFSQIFHELDTLCKKVNEFNLQKHPMEGIVSFASFVHNEFQHIHPFDDGNSRVTRLIWNYVLMRQGFPLINIYSNTREEYLSLTKLARKRDDLKLNAFLVKIIKDNLYKRLRI